MKIPLPPTRKTPLVPERIRSWEEVLDLAGFPRPVIVLDFETFFTTEYSLKKMSTIEHITDERFEVLGLSVVEEESAPRFIREPEVRAYLDNLQRLYGPDLAGCTVVAHNAAYDCAILNWIYDIRPKFIIDTLGLARHWNSRAMNGLEFLAEREGLPPKGDTLRFKEWTTRRRYKPRGGRKKKFKMMPIRLPLITEPMWKELEDYANHDGFLEWELFKRYMPRVSRPEVELNALNHTMHLYIDPVIQVDEKVGLEIIDAMEEEIDLVMAEVGHTRQEISGENSFEGIMEDALVLAGDDIGHYLKGAKNKRGFKLAIAKADRERELLETHADARVRQLMAAKNALSSWPNHITRVRNIIAQCKAAGGVLPVPLRYFGAHTGRWSGGEKINLQNLGSRGHRLIKRIRTMLIAPPGHEFVIADASAIEMVILAYIAGQWDKCAKFENNEEIYCRFAEKVLGMPVGSLRKPVKEEDWERLGCDPEVERLMAFRRNSIGKVGELGCGYGMGWKKAIGYSDGALDPQMAQDVVYTYREDNPEIVAFWKAVEAKFIYTAKYGKPCRMPRGLHFRKTKDVDVIITLPSGHEIKYHQVRIKQDKFGHDKAQVLNPKTRKWDYIWGGTLTENIVQAIARDVLWEAIVKMEKAGHRVVHHVHDELIALVLAGCGKKVLDFAVDCLRERPKWGQKCPLNGEGVVTTRYGDH
jgi:DNA polymerase